MFAVQRNVALAQFTDENKQNSWKYYSMKPNIDFKLSPTAWNFWLGGFVNLLKQCFTLGRISCFCSSFISGPRVQWDMRVPNDSALVLGAENVCFFKREPFNTFIAGGEKKKIFEMCFAKRKKKIALWNSQLELTLASYSWPRGEWKAALALRWPSSLE